MAGYFELKSSDQGRFSFNLKAGNHEVVLSSQPYASRRSALAGIAAVRNCAPQAERFQRKLAKDNSVYFVLRAGNGQIIGKSQMYPAVPAMENGIRSVMANGTSATIKGLDADE
jgi:uncharacterized protein YegP (UPF0339 family)